MFRVSPHRRKRVAETTTFAQATPHDLADIPAYVIRPGRANRSRYHAPRLSRASLTLRELRDLQQRSWSQRMVNSWRRSHGVVVPTQDELVTELRYRSTARVPVYAPQAAPARLPVPAADPRLLTRCLAAMALCGAAAALGWAIGTQMQPAAAAPHRAIPASVLIAGQNLPSKLPAIEAKAPAGTLEQGHRIGTLTYVVQAGDSFHSVGERFGLTARTVRLANRMALGDRLKPGQQITITPGDGAMYACQAGETGKDLAERYSMTVAALSAANPGVHMEKLPAGAKLFIPGAQDIRLPKPKAHEEDFRGYRNDHNDGSRERRLEISRSLIGEFGNRVGSLSWPAAGQVSSPFGIRGYSFHPGMDICNVAGTPVHAAKAGTVIAAGWSSGYGYAVDIDHGGGIVTRYGHCSRLLVHAGQQVAVGEEIALMGSTGFSTGPHCHFEVRIQGRAVNPASFL